MSRITYFELKTLEKDLNVSSKFLYSLSNNIYSHYKEVKISKKSGGFRTLEIPDKELKIVQRKISHLISTCFSSSKYCKSYALGKNVISNAIPHLHNNIVVKLDIKDYFGHIIYSQVKDKVFTEDIFSEQNRILLSILVTYDGILPQGSPCSPIISNLILKDFDDFIGDWCKHRNITYTRYCDDLTFSGDDFDYNELIKFVAENLKKNGFFLNNRKTSIIKNGQRKKITGIIVNEKINVPIEYRKQIRKEMYYINKFGLNSHLEHINCNSNANDYLLSLLGKINYILSINCSDEFTKYLYDVKKLLN